MALRNSLDPGQSDRESQELLEIEIQTATEALYHANELVRLDPGDELARERQGELELRLARLLPGSLAFYVKGKEPLTPHEEDKVIAEAIAEEWAQKQFNS